MTPLAELLGESPGIVAAREKIGRLLEHHSDARRRPPILIHGETGTGKGLLARAIHGAGPRRDGPFVDVNCAAIPETLLEAELFGFERGAFTDARQAKAGLFQVAHRGTLFLDEVGLLPEGLQAKLLTAIEERVVRRLGSTRSEPVDVWILAASNEDLSAATRARRFREDLYHRLAVVTLWLPPLRERGEDILLLAEHFLARACADYGLPSKTLAPDARSALLAYRWPGNIRELANVMERVALLSEAPLVTAEMLGLPEAPPTEPREAARGTGVIPLEERVGSVERAHLLEALREANWNISRAAARLGIPRNTLRYRIEKYGLRPGGASDVSRRPAQRHPAPVPTAPHAAAAQVKAPSAVRWERRRITFLRAKLIGPEGADPVADTSRAIKTLTEKVQGFGGRVEGLSPTGVVAAFGLEPVEDAPRRAALAAMAIQQAIERSRRDEAAPLGIKIGIHVGQVLGGQAGQAVEIELDAKREAWGLLESLVAGAEAEAILVSAAARPFLERRFQLVPVGSREPAAGEVYRLTEPRRTAFGPPGRITRFVGRRQELEMLCARLESAVQGHGQVVGVLGEAGIGKSRLLFEFRQGLTGERVGCLEGRCVSYGNAIPYLPVLEMLRQACRMTETDTPEAIAEKVRLSLATLGMEVDDAVYLLHFLGVKEGTERLAALTGEAINLRTCEILTQMCLRRSRQAPLVLAVEDLHWIDKASETYFAWLVDRLAGAPILLLLTYRPGYRPAWTEKSYATQVALQPLAPEDSLRVVQSVLQTETVPEPLAQVILQKAEGNPFFLEELARAVGEQGDLRPPGAVPDTIQEVLLARINRLPAGSRRLLQTVSVLGREGSLRLLEAIWDPPGSLDAPLRELTRLEFLYEHIGAEEPVYVFKHPLTQEVAGESLLPPDRQALHVAAGRAIERLYANRLEEVYARLAYHYSKTAEAAKAVEYLTRFAEKAARGYAHAEAVTALEEALVHIERLPADRERDRLRIDLVRRQAESLNSLGRVAETLSLLLEERERLDRLEEPTLAGPYYVRLAVTYGNLGGHEWACQCAQRALEEAKRCGDEPTMGKAHLVLAREGFMSGALVQGAEHGRQAAALLEQTGEQWWLGMAYWVLAMNYGFMGEFQLALEAAARTEAIGDIIDDPRLRSYAAWTAGATRAIAGEWEAGIAACRRGLEHSPDPISTANALGFSGFAYVEAGDPNPAIALLEQSVQRFDQFGMLELKGLFTALLGEAYLLKGQIEKARECAMQGLAITSEVKYSVGVAFAQRALGRVAQADGALSEAAMHLNQALQTFASVQARFEVGRTHLALAELAIAQGNQEAVTTHLREAHLLFATLRVPKYVERTEGLAHDFGVPV